MAVTTFGFVGLGLIGGSIAKAIKEKTKDSYLIAYDISEETRNAAFLEGTADVVTDSIDSHFAACDYIFLCAPVQKNDENLLKIKDFLSEDCLLTDVGSVKTGIHQAIRDLGLSRQFIGGHPMAGSERVGYVNSKSILLENAYYILTPTDQVSQAKITAYRELVTELGTLPLILTCEQHDYVTAAISHLPHVIASSLVNLVRESDSSEGIMKMIAAGGFKDITRIASSSPAMWQQICLSNTENISRLLEDYIASLEAVRRDLDSRDAGRLYTLFDSARTYRDSFIGASSGPIKKDFSMNIDIADEPGALAAIATILALHQINIKNIGIVHNREQEGGVLRIEFYEEASIARAGQILSGKGYTVYEKN